MILQVETIGRHARRLTATRPTIPAAQARTGLAYQADREVRSIGCGTECDELLMATAQGDRPAFQRLYHLTSARLFATVRRSIWIRSEAEEVLQEVYLKIWAAASAYDPVRSQALTWMMRVARNHAIDHLRRGAARRAHEHSADSRPGRESDVDAEVVAVDDSPRPDEWLENEQNQRQFEQLLEGLGAIQRQVLVLAFREGCTQADIALRLDAPLGSVKSWMRRALQKLKSTIESDQQLRKSHHN